MATKKFIIEVEEGKTECIYCPLQRYLDPTCQGINDISCKKYKLSTMKIKEYEDKD